MFSVARREWRKKGFCRSGECVIARFTYPTKTIESNKCKIRHRMCLNEMALWNLTNAKLFYYANYWVWQSQFRIVLLNIGKIPGVRTFLFLSLRAIKSNWWMQNVNYEIENCNFSMSFIHSCIHAILPMCRRCRRTWISTKKSWTMKKN